MSMTADSVEYHAGVLGLEPGQVLGHPGLAADQVPQAPQVADQPPPGRRQRGGAAMTAATATRPRRPDSGIEGRAGFGNVISSEWMKIRTVRSTFWTLVTLFAGSALITLLICLAAATPTPRTWPRANRTQPTSSWSAWPSSARSPPTSWAS